MTRGRWLEVGRILTVSISVRSVHDDLTCITSWPPPVGAHRQLAK